MDTDKPFDVLIIESPFEYYGKMSNKAESIRCLGELCRQYQIPIRVPNGLKMPPICFNGYYREQPQDTLIRDYFEGCNYEPNLDLEEIAHLKSDGDVRILLSGGLLNYMDIKELSRIPSLGNLDDPKSVVIPSGCVSARAINIYQDLLKYDITPKIYIDCQSATGYDQMDPNSVLQVIEVKDYYIVTKKIPRSSVITN